VDSRTDAALIADTQKDLPILESDKNVFVLSIGVTDKLQFAGEDAKMLPEVIRNHFGAADFNVTGYNQLVILDPAKDSLRTVFNAWQRQIKKEDIFVFYYAGISNSVDSTCQDIFISLKGNTDNNPTDTDNLLFTELMAWIDQVEAKDQLIILDAGDNKCLVNLIEERVLQTDPLESILSDRNRVYLTTNGPAVESQRTQGGYMMYILNNFNTLHDVPNKRTRLLNGISIFDLFTPELRKEVQFEFDRICIEKRLHLPNKPYHSIVFEDDIRRYLQRTSKWFLQQEDSIKWRGTTTIQNKTNKIVDVQLNSYSLVVGMDDYESSDWSDLNNPVFDAKTIHDILEKDFGFNSVFLKNPTKEEILTKILEFREVITDSSSQFLFFFAGHGDYSLPIEGTLITSNTKDAADDPLKLSHITHANLRNYLNNVPSKHVLVVLDACFGGTFDQKLSANTFRAKNDEYQTINTPELIQRKMKYRSRLYLTSGGKEYVPDGRSGYHSPFARSFIGTLREASSDFRIVTMNQLKLQFETLQPEPRAGEFGANQPGADFIFVPRLKEEE
jgi:hypothetical protein